MGTTKAQVEVDFNLNGQLRSEVLRQRKFEDKEITKERAMGRMIEERAQLEKALGLKKMTFTELITFLTKK